MEKFGIYILEDSEKITRSNDDSRQAIYTNAAMICNNEDEDGGGWGAAGSYGPYVIVEVNFKIDLDNPKLPYYHQNTKSFYIDNGDTTITENPTKLKMCKLLKCTKKEFLDCVDKAVDEVLDKLEEALEDDLLDEYLK